MPALVSDVALAELRRDEMLRYLGHRGQALDAALNARMDEAATRCLALARPRMAVRRFRVAGRASTADGTPELRLSGTSLVLVGYDVSSLLAGAREVGVLAVTLGMDVERELRRLSLAGDTLGQVLFDAAATTAVEQAADAAEALLVAQAAEQGQGTTARFSPGYGDLPLSCQAAVLASLDAGRRLGVSLTESDLLVPTKSVTAVVGIGPGTPRARRAGCAACSLREQCALSTEGCQSHEPRRKG